MHWTFPPEVIRPLLPSGLGLELDTYGGRAYVGLVPFTMRGVRPKGLPAVPWLSNFPETNVRTYVHFEGRAPGVWFFSLEAANPIAVAVARAWFSLPYYYAPCGSMRGSWPTGSAGSAGRFRITPSASKRDPYPQPRPSTRTFFRMNPARRCWERSNISCWSVTYFTPSGVVVSIPAKSTTHPIRFNPPKLTLLTRLYSPRPGSRSPEERPIVHFSGGVDVEIFPLRPAAGS